MFFEVIILAVEAIKRTGIVKDGQVFITILRPVGNGMSRVAGPLTTGTDKIRYTVRGKGIMVTGQVPFMGSSSLEFSGFDAAKAAKACATLGYPAPVDAERTGNTICCTGRAHRKSIFPPAVIVNGFDFRPDLLKMSPDTIRTEADHLGDGLGCVIAVLACTHFSNVSLCLQK